MLSLVATILFLAVVTHSVEADERCYLPMDLGYKCPLESPKDPSLKWFYDPDQDDCSQFFFRGCGGTWNRFPSKKRCMRFCSGMTMGSCFEERENKWYRNGDSKTATCGSCVCMDGTFSCAADAACLEAMHSKSCGLIFCPDKDLCISGEFHKDEKGCRTCICKE